MAVDTKQLEKKIKENSAAWHSADETGKKALERANQDLYAQLDKANGTTSTLDTATGVWTTSEAAKSGGSSGETDTGSYRKYTGGNEVLDEKLAEYGQQYQQGRSAALAGDSSGVTAMREANDRANQLRNQYGYAAELADQDIATVKSKLPADGSGAKGESGGSGLVRDYSDYIRSINSAQQAKALQALRTAYEKNVSQLESTRAALPAQYQQARNQAAAENSQQRKVFQEYAAASGLNSGTGGQAELALGNVLQSALAELNGQEQSALTQLDLQRQQMEQDYQDSITEAQLSGDAQLAQSLYEEKVRVDEAYREEMERQAKQAYQQAQLEQKQAQQEREWADEEDRRWEEAILSYAEQTGDYSGLSGTYTAEQIRRLEQAWQEAAEQAEQEEAWDLAQQKAKYGDYSGLRALGVDVSTLTAQKSSGKSTGKSTSTKKGSTSQSKKTATETESTQNGDAGEGLSQRNMAAVKQTIGRCLQEGERGRAVLESTLSDLWDRLSDSQKTEITGYIKSLGGSVVPR